jgi:hypothetical protein
VPPFILFCGYDNNKLLGYYFPGASVLNLISVLFPLARPVCILKYHLLYRHSESPPFHYVDTLSLPVQTARCQTNYTTSMPLVETVMHDAILNTAIIWKHIWNKVSAE